MENDQKTSSIDLDSVLVEIGSFGKYQIVNYFLIFLAIVISTPYVISYIFVAGDLNYRCRVNHCDESDNSYSADHVNFSIPYKNDELSKCDMYGVNNNSDDGNCSEHMFDRTRVVHCKDDFVYETEEITIVNDFGLHCDENKWKLSLVGTIDTVGQFFALPLTGYLSDKYGRRFALVFGFIASGIFGLVRSFAPSYIVFLVLEFLGTAIGSGIYSSLFILAMEMSGSNYRTFASVMIFTGFGTGEVMFGFLAMMTQNWRLLVRITYSLAFLFISYYWILPESVRWLQSVNKHEQTENELKRAAKMNRVLLSRSTLDSLERWIDGTGSNHDNRFEPAKTNIKLIFQYPTIVIRVLSLSFIWITNTLCFYGLSLNAVALGGNKYTNFIAVCAIEIPGYFLGYFLINKIGRKITLSAALIVCGISSLCNGLIEPAYVWKLILFLVGKAAIAISFQTLYLYTAELFPTVMRHRLLGWCSTFGRFGAMLAPQTPLLESVSKSLPVLLFGGTAFISGLLTLQYPETLNCKLPDTLDDAVNMGKTKRLNI